MREIARLSAGNDDWQSNPNYFSSFSAKMNEFKQKYGVEEIYFWPEIYKSMNFLTATPEREEIVMVFGIKE